MPKNVCLSILTTTGMWPDCICKESGFSLSLYLEEPPNFFEAIVDIKLVLYPIYTHFMSIEDRILL
jgi:hypothetical protein